MNDEPQLTDAQRIVDTMLKSKQQQLNRLTQFKSKPVNLSALSLHIAIIQGDVNMLTYLQKSLLTPTQQAF